ncbi:MAG TPA: hypothetical protein ENJ27_01705 [Candidatus Moranbacteria bacterium]|nr:hypothetical protein [Candidatus Moranbacteria bacterium]
MKRIMPMVIVVSFLFTGISSKILNSSKNDTCKQNVKEMCQEYDDFLAFFYGQRNWRVSLDFFEVPKYEINEKDPMHDPLSDKFYFYEQIKKD